MCVCVFWSVQITVLFFYFFIFFSSSLFLSLLHDEAPPVGGECVWWWGHRGQETVCEGGRGEGEAGLFGGVERNSAIARLAFRAAWRFVFGASQSKPREKKKSREHARCARVHFRRGNYF